MALSNEVKALAAAWDRGAKWPQQLEWLEIDGIRGWEGQRFEMRFPIMAVVGENGVGKSTVLQAAASVYRSDDRKGKGHFPTDHFPETTWDELRGVTIRYSVQVGQRSFPNLIGKNTDRWRRLLARPERKVRYVDLSRIQPLPARVGYTRLANRSWRETRTEMFDSDRVGRVSAILGRPYGSARMAWVDADEDRSVPVLENGAFTYSGFHQGAGETTVADLLEKDLPKYSLVLIDEVESSLHPRAQRRLVRDLAHRCRTEELQIIMTTHSPFILEELPRSARAQITQDTSGRREIVYGVSPEFAMNHMDDQPHPEVEIYVEDERAETLVVEAISYHAPSLRNRVATIPAGAADTIRSLGQIIKRGRFPRASLAFLDGDMGPAPGCHVLPGGAAPERVVFKELHNVSWANLASRIARSPSQVIDACTRAMVDPDHHRWLRAAADDLTVGTDELWFVMCSEWSQQCLTPEQARVITDPIEYLLAGGTPIPVPPAPRKPPAAPTQDTALFPPDVGTSQ